VSTWGFDPSFYFTSSGASEAASLRIEIAGLAGSNEFGWYDTTDPGVLHPIFTGPDSAGAAATFLPSASFGLYLATANGNTFRTTGTGSDPRNQHFAVFEGTGTEEYWLGMEDTPFNSGSDRDYNDMIVRMQASAVPEPATFLTMGTLLLLAGNVIRIRNRRRSRRSTTSV